MMNELYNINGLVGAYFAIKWPHYQKYMEEDWWKEEVIMKENIALIPTNRVSLMEEN